MQSNEQAPQAQQLALVDLNQLQTQKPPTPKKPHSQDEKFERPDPGILSMLRWAAVRAIAGFISGSLISATVAKFFLVALTVCLLISAVFVFIQWLRWMSLREEANRRLVVAELVTVLVAANVGAHFETILAIAKFLGGI